MVLSVYYVLRKIIGVHYWVILIGLFLYVVYEGLPVNLWRQISALSMEYAAIFLLPGITLFIEYFRKKKMVYLILAGECLAITVLIHIYAAVALSLAYILISICYWRVMLQRGIFLKFATVMMTAGIGGLVPLIIGFLTQPIGDMSYATESIQSARNLDFTKWISVYLSTNRLIQILLIAAFVVLMYRIYGIFRTRKDNLIQSYSIQAESALLFIFIMFYLVYESGSYGLPVLIPADRFGVFFALSSALAMAVILKQVMATLPFIRDRNLLKSLLVLILAATVLLSGNVNSAPIGFQYQYDETVEIYLQIKEELPPLEWTVISPVEDYHLIYGKGRHSQLWEFVQTLSHPEGKTLKFPTHDIFIFVEKIPLGSDKEITEEDALLLFPEFDGTDLTEFYYRNTENRKIIEAKVYKWAENRMKDLDMTIYYDSTVLRVYRVHQDGTKPQDLLEERD